MTIAASILVACDPFQEDLISSDNQLTIKASATDYYILPGSSAIIDLSSIVSSLFTTVSIKVSDNPTMGKLTTIDDLILKYEPLAVFNEGDDQFEIAFINGGNTLDTAVIKVHMMPNTTLFPCSIYAVEDIVSIATSSTVSINVLDNDGICGVKKENVQVSIYRGPKYGKASLNGESISYSSSSGYKGCDQIIYKISTTGDNPKTSFGLVNLRAGEDPCGFILNEEWNGLNIHLASDANVSMCLTILELAITPFELAESPGNRDGKYAFVYDVVNDYGAPRDIDFTVTISTVGSTIEGNKGMLSFKGHDTADLLDGPKPTQYLEKVGSNFINISEIDSDVGHQSMDLTIAVTWDTWDGTPGSYNLDVYLKQVKDCAGNRWDDFGPGLVTQIGLSENPGNTFESMTTDLGADDLYEIDILFREGASFSNNATFTITVSTEEGILHTGHKERRGSEKKMSFTYELPQPDLIPGASGSLRIIKRGRNLYLDNF